MIHGVGSVHERHDTLPEPVGFVAEVVCTCARLFASAVHPDAEAARSEAMALFDEHLPEEASKPAEG